MSSIAVTNGIIIVTKGLHIDCFDGENHKIINITTNNLQTDDKIADVVISSDKKYLAVLTTISKKLIIYNLSTLNEERVFTLPRTASKIRFTVDNTQVLVADKTGDGLIYNILTEESGSKLFGHLSLLLNILQTNDGKYIITSDRDEKIRVTCYPNTYSIHTYCLGHKEFVNNLEFLPHNDKYLISSSGDGTLKCWNYEKGNLCHTIEVHLDVNYGSLQEEFKKCMDEEGVEVEHLPVVHFTIMRNSASCSIFAVSIHLVKKIFIYTLQTENDKLIHKFIDTIDLNNFPVDVKFFDSLLFIYFANCELLQYKITCNNNNLQVNVNFVKKIDTFVGLNTGCSIDSNIHNPIKVLYKRRFDNVQEYQERKKQRLGIIT